MAKIVVTGAGGFVGNNLVRYLKTLGHEVRGVDIKYPLWCDSQADEFLYLDLRYPTNAYEAFEDMEIVFALAADMGGMAFIADQSIQAEMGRNNSRIALSCLEAARLTKTIKHYLFTSSVCIYPTHLLAKRYIKPLTEEEAIPAQPQGVYGWEKLYTEILCHAYREQYGLNTHIVRLQNTYGPYCEWRDAKNHPSGVRTKAPAALCRKAAIAKYSGDNTIEVWGDGLATRTFMHIQDAVRGIYLVGTSDYTGPVTLGPDRVISINELVEMIADIAGIQPEIRHIDGPEGVRGRNFDHRLIHSLGWEPQVELEAGMRNLYQWVERQVKKNYNFGEEQDQC